MPGLCVVPTCDIHVASSGAEIVQNVYNVLERTLRACRRKEPIIVGLSGGSIVHTMMEVLPSLNEDYLERLRFVFCDETRVPFDQAESTFGQYSKFVLPRLQPTVGKEQFLCINPYLKPDECAKDYESKLRRLVAGASQWPEMDIVFLGVDENGRTCSLIPGHPVLEENRSWIASVTPDTPHRAPDSITLTLPVLNRARNIVFIVTGQSKANVVKKIFESHHDEKKSARNLNVPAAMVDPIDCATRVHWILDAQSAGLLSENIEN